MFVVEKDGLLKVVAPGGSTASLVLDLNTRVNSAHDRGLLGLAVDSQFAQHPYLYLLYTYELNPMTPDSTSPMVSQLLRVRINSASQVTEQTVLMGTYTSGVCPAPANTLDCLPSEGLSHSIGTVRSAPDGTLWVGNGDAASFSYVDSARPAHLRRAESRRQADARRPQRDGPARASLLPGRLRACPTPAPSSTRRAFATPFASRCARAAGSRSATSAGTSARRST